MVPAGRSSAPLTTDADLVAHDIKHIAGSQLFGYVDTDWAGDVEHRRSVTGLGFMLAGAAVHYKTRYQGSVAGSSTEAEFVGGYDAGKGALYIRSILDEIRLPQDYATPIYEDNNGAIMMANAGKPTKRTRHIDIKFFSLLEWVERDLVILESIDTTCNASDTMTKSLGRILFNRHKDIMMGRRPPHYVQDYVPNIS